MARPNPNTTRLGSITIKPEWALNLDRLATADGRTISDLVRDALRDYFKKRGVPA